MANSLINFICRLVFFQEEFEHPTEDDLNRVYHVPLQEDGSATSSESDHLFRHMTEMTILTVQLIVEFSKHLPGFQTLCRDDQVRKLTNSQIVVKIKNVKLIVE